MGFGLYHWTSLPLWADLLAASVMFLTVSLLGRSLSTRFFAEEARGLTHATTRFTAERQTTLRTRVVGEVATVSWCQPRRRVLWASLGAYAGRPLRFLALLYPRASIDGLVRQAQGAIRNT